MSLSMESVIPLKYIAENSLCTDFHVHKDFSKADECLFKTTNIRLLNNFML